MLHIQGQCRQQATLFPESLEDFIPADHSVRVIDGFIEQLSLVELGFSKAIPAATGRPPYAPSDLLKLYVYEYLNQIQSSRRLEHASQSNVEVMWLLNRLSPDFKTLAVHSTKTRIVDLLIRTGPGHKKRPYLPTNHVVRKQVRPGHHPF